MIEFISSQAIVTIATISQKNVRNLREIERTYHSQSRT